MNFYIILLIKIFYFNFFFVTSSYMLSFHLQNSCIIRLEENLTIVKLRNFISVDSVRLRIWWARLPVSVQKYSWLSYCCCLKARRAALPGMSFRNFSIFFTDNKDNFFTMYIVCKIGTKNVKRSEAMLRGTFLVDGTNSNTFWGWWLCIFCLVCWIVFIEIP